ncbi:MAG: MoxR-like ATPase [Planctomycetota bacterium]|jgi:MoxR-like ATPase
MSTDSNTNSAEGQTEAEIEQLRGKLRELRESLDAVFYGYRAEVDLLIQAFLTGGHILLEGAPGLGKTTLVHALAGALDLDFGRIQFTPDLMPADILGSRILLEDPATGQRSFSFERGPIFANVILADEINRATPRTQSALLEAMQEGQVTLHGTSHPLDQPFLVIATENPVEMEGTYPLPEAQLDRFVCKIELGSPGQAQLVKILSETTGANVAELSPCLSKDAMLRTRQLVREVLASSDIIALVANLVRATDPKSDNAPDSIKRFVRFGASPRGGQAILLLSKARALSAGRVFVTREDVEATACPALRHRLVLGYEAEAASIVPDELIREALNSLG